MARPLRIEFPGAFYHVMNRGNTGMKIYTGARGTGKSSWNMSARR